MVAPAIPRTRVKFAPALDHDLLLAQELVD
jgi:hypothetical protein